MVLVGLAGLTIEMGEREAADDTDVSFGMEGMLPMFVGVGIGVLCAELAAVKLSVLGWERRLDRLP